ncbi:ethylbenzene dehydrogenase-related protein [Microbulbifer sp. ALW1]|uniref:ethylbenzene dehydrogenase-related protein n=1 Tax=Microbulbifer sp. (strain ALW1) TaxID=1516059 RepID=UPI0019130516|nr:ethylbenzene dehydrogenase-related protein [Microbulbifer sp. ALW1]
MAANRKSLRWILLHTCAAGALLCSLLTGLRIASLTRPQVSQFEELLPQGGVIQWHFVSAVVFSLVVIAYIAYRVFPSIAHRTARAISTDSKKARDLHWPGWHRAIIRAGYPLLGLSLLSGWLLFYGWGNWGIGLNPRDWHFLAALGALLYLVFHAGLYLARWGRQSLALIAIPRSGHRSRRRQWIGGALLGVAVLVFTATWLFTSQQSQFRLEVTAIPLLDPDHAPIEIDGNADEPQWQMAMPITVYTDGGTNFDEGATEITLRALSNGEEFYLSARWRDDSQSLVHLPLLKTAQGWEVQQQGFHNFDETRFYEDKFAVLLSSSCTFAAAGTAHLGRKPLAERPANWHGKGYHYSSDGQLHDLWHWKAVRTNDMYLADDNFIGPPDKERPGERRYTAGYQQDGKESGAYVMNWQWYKPQVITPKRLPADPAQLAALQGIDPEQRTNRARDWVIPWFDYQPYSPEQDIRYPQGTVMPSVMYNSNRFEGDRADVRARGQWRDGYWNLEFVRKRVTSSALDVPIVDGTCLWVSAFDHAQVAHTRHTRAIRLQFLQELSR